MPVIELRKSQRVAKGFIYVICIIGALLVYGLWQERIMSEAYGEHYFSTSVFLVFWNRIFGMAFAMIMICIMGEPCGARAPLWRYLAISVSTVLASICQYEALKYVSFTVQILGKSCKMAPVMVWGQCVFRRKYRCADWGAAILVTMGVIWFLLSGNIQPEHHHGSSWYGILLLFGFVCIDSFTSTFQERLFAEHKTSKYNQMLYINTVSSILSILILLATSNWGHAFRMMRWHPRLWGDISILSGAAVVAQWFIYSQVQDFGALAFATTMNLRQIVSVIASYCVYGHAITAMQIIGLCIVAAALAFQNLAGCLAEDKEKAPLVNKDGKEDPEQGVTISDVKRWSVKMLTKTGNACCVPCLGTRTAK